MESMMDIFQRGGPVMWPIAVCSIAGLTVALERFYAMASYTFANARCAEAQQRLIRALREGAFDTARDVAQTMSSPIGRIARKALENRDTGFAETLGVAAQHELNRLRRGFSVLDTVITATPMLGILGTVTGIIQTFQTLNVNGAANPTAATAGIGEALITTAAGLIVALICLFPFNFLVSRLKAKTTELEMVTHQLEVAYKKGKTA